ncbi:hypothetical protein [Magnetospira sp. QH-2]|nr:hypothetical protein [Magnetospira sp. QH-2]
MPEPDQKRTNDRAVATDWMDELPITEAELDLVERHFLDLLTSMIQAQ